MKKIFTFLILCNCCHGLMGQDITIGFFQPYGYQTIPIVDSVMRVDAEIRSTLPLASVTARVEDRQIALTTTPRSRGHYLGDLSLLGLPQLRLLYVYVTAVDTAGNQAVDSQEFVYVHSPLLAVDSPLSWSVASPLLPVKAKCTAGTGICDISVRWNNGTERWLGRHSVDTVIDLSPYQGTMGSFWIVATDAFTLQRTSLTVPAYVDSSAHLQQVFAANDLIDDFNYHRVFVTNPWLGRTDYLTTMDLNPFQYRSRIVDVVSRDSIPLAEQGAVYTGNNANRITPSGMLYTTRTITGGPFNLYDANRGSVSALGQLDGSKSLRLAGHYALWSNRDTLFFRDLQTRINTVVSTNVGNDFNDVAGNGVVAYWSRDYSIYRWQDSVATGIVSHSSYNNFAPVTDGHLIVYGRNSSGVNTIRLNDGLTDTALSNLGAKQPNSGNDDQVNNGFVAYTKYDDGGVLQVWLRDTLGVSRQMTAFATDSWIDKLGPNGDMVIVNKVNGSSGKRFFAERAGGMVTELCSSLGTVYNRGGDWFLTMGRMLYRLNIGAALSAPPEPALSGMKDTLCRLGAVQKVRLLNLPDTQGIATVAAALDGSALTLAAESTVALDPGALAAGAHVLDVTYTNPLGTSHWTHSFVVLAVDSPDVRLSSNISEVVNLTGPVVLTATALAGGGAAPRFTFSTDREFTHLLQAESTASVLTIQPSTLSVGRTIFFVRMRTSDSCYAWATDVDSVQVERIAVTGIIDPAFPDQVISMSPNPFIHDLRISGLQLGELYRLTIRNGVGQTLFQYDLQDAPVAAVHTGALTAGQYWITLYDRKKNRVIGTMAVLKADGH